MFKILNRKIFKNTYPDAALPPATRFREPNECLSQLWVIQDGGDEKSDPDICYFNTSPLLDSGDGLYIYYSELLHLSAVGNFNAHLSSYLII